MLDLLISFLLLYYFFSLLFESQVLLLAHLRVPQNPILDEVIGLKRALQHEPLMVLEETSTLHSSLLP